LDWWSKYFASVETMIKVCCWWDFEVKMTKYHWQATQL
jgi:hypothetical protein